MKNYLKSFNILTDEDIEMVMPFVRQKTMQKGDYFIKEGQISTEVAFVERGMFRSFYYSSEEEEVTYCFTFAGSFISAYSSFLAQTPTTENIQALTDIEMYAISKTDVESLEERSLNWLRLFKLITEHEYIKMEKRVFMLQKESAQKRYEDLLSNQPELLNLIPLQYLSSYLGITQRHLSRIRKSI